MTPPILQLYIVFFGLGGLLASRLGVTPGSFLVAALVLSLYAGATNAVLLRRRWGSSSASGPACAPLRLIPAAVERSYEGLVSTLGQHRQGGGARQHHRAAGDGLGGERHAGGGRGRRRR